MRRLALPALSLLAACQLPLAASSSSGDGTTVIVDEATTASEGPGDATSEGTGDASTGAATGPSATTLADTTIDPSSSGGEPTGDGTTGDDATSTGTTGEEIKSCKKVDILFQIVDRGELWDTDVALLNLMPHLAERLETDFADWDYHLMFVNSSGTWGSKYCEEACQEVDVCKGNTLYPCDYDPDACDLTLGAGVTFPAGGGASNVPCPIDGDQRYIVRGQDDLAGTLECLRRVGFGYGLSDVAKHRVARATLDAIDGPLNDPDACNEGFFRDDAYLVLFVLSTIPDFYSDGTPADWTKELKGHKGGKFDKIYFIGLFGGCDSGFGWKEFEPLNEWVSALYHHVLDDACTGELIPYVDPALDYVLGDCQE